MAREEVAPERALLWSIYWGLRALSDPTPTLERARSEAWALLHSTPPSPSRCPRPNHLTLVGGEN